MEKGARKGQERALNAGMISLSLSKSAHSLRVRSSKRRLAVPARGLNVDGLAAQACSGRGQGTLGESSHAQRARDCDSRDAGQGRLVISLYVSLYGLPAHSSPHELRAPRRFRLFSHSHSAVIL